MSEYMSCTHMIVTYSYHIEYLNQCFEQWKQLISHTQSACFRSINICKSIVLLNDNIHHALEHDLSSDLGALSSR